MRTLAYKMTHIGDPDPATGLWGKTGCMGQVRGYQFDAVIGIAGTSAIDGIAGKIVWIGTGPRKNGSRPESLVKFDRFLFLGNRGPSLYSQAPKLARHIYGGERKVAAQLLAGKAQRGQCHPRKHAPRFRTVRIWAPNKALPMTALSAV